MVELYIKQGKSTPEINFDAENNKLEIRGQSYPENAFKFYDPVLNWVDEYLKQVKGEVTIEIDLNLPYINTSSSKCIMMLLDKLEKAFQEGTKIVINWYYDENNDSELECAEEFKEDVNLPINLVPVSKNQ